MPQSQLFPAVQTLTGTNGIFTSGQNLTTSGTSSSFSLPECACYSFLLVAPTVSGTTPTLDVSIASSPDGGTTYFEILQFDQITTTQAKRITFQPFLGAGESASKGAVGVVGTIDLATGTGVANNQPFDPRYVKVRWQITGTITTLNASLFMIATPMGQGSTI